MNRKERILQYLQQTTERVAAKGFAGLEGLETIEIAQALRLDRANVSKLLNDLWNDSRIIKIQGRPTLYLSHRAMREALPGQFIPYTISGVEKFRELCQGSAEDVGLAAPLAEQRIVGNSIQRSIQEALPVCLYPPYGLPMVLVTASQEDAVTFAGGIFERLKESRPAGAKMVSVDCRGSTKGDDSFLRRLFGCSRELSPSARGVKSSFELSAHGLVYLDGVHRLPPYILEMLVSAIDRRSYCRLGETVSRPLDATLILSLPPQSGEALLARLGKHVPYIQVLPPLDSRGLHERLTLLLKAVARESAAIGYPLRVERDVLAYLLSARYPAGISELRNVVRLLCSSVLQGGRSEDGEHLAIECRHLPQRILTDVEEQLPQLARARRVLSLVPNRYFFFSPNGVNEPLQLFQNIFLRVGALDAIPDAAVFYPDGARLRDPRQYIEEFLDYLLRCDSGQVAQLQRSVPYYIFQNAEKRVRDFPGGEGLTREPVLLLGMLNLMLQLFLRRQHLPLPSGTLPAPTEELSRPCRAIFSLFCDEEVFSLSEEESAFFASYLTAAAGLARDRRVAILILCHGEGVASGYAGLLQDSSQEEADVAAIDVAKGEPLVAVIRRAIERAKVLDRGAGLVVAVDLPPLLSVAAAITEQSGIPCRAVGEVSLFKLLDLAEQCRCGKSLVDLAEAHHLPAEPEDLAFAEQDPFMRRYLSEAFAPALTFLNVPKAAQTLSKALADILGDLHIAYSHEIAIKFLSHSSCMLERAISGNAMSFPNLRPFLRENQALVAVVERRLEPVANTFGTSIPAAEIAYIAEIFRNYK